MKRIAIAAVILLAACTLFSYQTHTLQLGDAGTLRVIDVVDVGDLSDEAAHGYAINGATVPWYRTAYYYSSGSFPVLDAGRSHRGSESFVVDAVPGRDFYIIGRNNPWSFYQKVNVFVDGRLVGALDMDSGRTVFERRHEYRDVSFLVPGAYVSSDKALVRLEYVSGDPDVNSYRYWIAVADDNPAWALAYGLYYASILFVSCLAAYLIIIYSRRPRSLRRMLARPLGGRSLHPERYLSGNLPLLGLLAIAAYSMVTSPHMNPVVYDNPGHPYNNYITFSGIANNIIKLGFIRSGFSQPLGVDASGNPFYYISHPPMLGNLVALSFLALTPYGVSQENAAVLVPTLFALGSLALVYLIGRRLWGTFVAFVSASVMALTPMFRKYAQMVCHESPTQFFILLAVYSYILWRDDRRKSNLYAMYAALALGCLAGWPAYYAILVLSTHSIIFDGWKSVRPAAAMIAVGAAMFALFLIQVAMVSGLSGVLYLEKVIDSRNNYNPSSQEYSTDLVGTFIKSLDNVRLGNTPYVYYGSVLLLVLAAYNVWDRRTVLPESYIVVLLLIGVIHNFIWPNGTPYHPYWGFYFTPGLVLAAVVGVESVLKGEKEYQRLAVWALLIVFWLANNTYSFPV